MSTVTLRVVTDADRDFILSVYGSTREDELATTDWSSEQKSEFCRQQFEAQDAHYRAHYPGATYDLILADGVPAGRLYVDRWDREIRIMEITLLPVTRGRGIGSALLRELQEETRETGKLLSIHVERFNPALTLYQRLGFTLAEDKGVYLLLHWRADPM